MNLEDKNYTRILGIDPGSIVAGFACIDIPKGIVLRPDKIQLVDLGVVKVDKKKSIPERLVLLHETFSSLASDLRPEICIVEKPFMGENANSAIRLGEARGAIIAGLFRVNRPSILEITPAQAKKCVTGNGGATKQEIALGVGLLLGIDLSGVAFDASDALAIAVAGALMLPTIQQASKMSAATKIRASKNQRIYF